jgi:hypothetical protein
MSKKSILEQALLQIETLEEAVKANAQGILASTMKQELNDLLKESMEQEDEQTQDDEPVTPEEDEEDMSDETSDDDDDTDDEEDLDNEDPTKGVDDMDSEDDDMDMDTDMDSEEDDMNTDMSSMDSMGGEDDELDMTGASAEEVLKVFKAMKPEDGIVVKKDGNNVELTTGDDDFIIKLDEEDYSTSDFDTSDDEMSMDDDEMSMDEEEDTTDEDVYEIDLGDDDDMGSSTEGDQTESARTIGNGYHAGIKSKKKYYAGNKRDEINEEVTKLRKQNLELKKALVLFKEKLNEVAVFNAGLAYSTQLFTEHSTTKQEKLNIMKRFNSISTLTEGKNLYKQLTTELGTKKPVTETVVNKITLTPKSSSTEILSESKAYENPQFKRMKDLMNKIK